MIMEQMDFITLLMIQENLYPVLRIKQNSKETN